MIQASGGTVAYERESAKARDRAALKRSLKGAPLPEETPTTRERIAAVIGRDYFDAPIAVRFVDLAQLVKPEPPQITPELLTRVAALPGLTLLDLSFNPGVTDELLVHLRGMKKLKTLQLYNSAIQGPGLEHIARLENLDYLDLSFTQIDDDALKWIAQSKNLTGLSISRTRVTDAGLHHLDGLQSLKNISLRDTSITDEAFKLLPKLPNLFKAELQHTNVTPEGVLKFQQEFSKRRLPLPYGPRLHLRYAFGKSPVDFEWQLGATQPSVAEVNTRFIELGILGIAGNDSNKVDAPPTRIRLGSSPVTDALLNLVNRLPSLSELSIGGSLVGDDLLRGLAGNTSIMVLILRDSRVTNAGLAYLAQLPNLEFLVLNDCDVTDAGIIKHITPLTKLKGITLFDSNVSAAGVRALQKAWPDLEIEY
jgi:Leucine-rich repeat (LRR) protein